MSEPIKSEAQIRREALGEAAKMCDQKADLYLSAYQDARNHPQIRHAMKMKCGAAKECAEKILLLAGLKEEDF